MSRLFPDLFQKKPNQYYEDVDVTDLTDLEKSEVISKMKQRGCISFAIGYENNRKYYIFWFEGKKVGRINGESIFYY